MGRSRYRATQDGGAHFAFADANDEGCPKHGDVALGYVHHEGAIGIAGDVEEGIAAGKVDAALAAGKCNRRFAGASQCDGRAVRESDGAHLGGEAVA